MLKNEFNETFEVDNTVNNNENKGKNQDLVWIINFLSIIKIK